jgi:hypothetical protein
MGVVMLSVTYDECRNGAHHAKGLILSVAMLNVVAPNYRRMTSGFCSNEEECQKHFHIILMLKSKLTVIKLYNTQ